MTDAPAPEPAVAAAMPEDDAPLPRRLYRSIALSVLAAVIEGYDATVFAVYAVVVGAKYFMGDSGASTLLLAMSAFAAGYLTRPFGALLLGALADRMGRKRTVALIVIVMSASTGLIGLLPTYETIGIAASIIVVSLRLLHGLAAGGSTAAGTLYIAELVPERHRGLYCSAKQSASVGSFLIAVLCGTTLLTVDDALNSSWVWRIPFLVALPLSAVGLWLQRYGEETADFSANRQQAATNRPIAIAFRNYKLRLLIAILSGILHNSSALIIFLFMPAYATAHLGISLADVTLAGVISACLIIAANTLGGHIADRVGFRKALFASGLLTLVVAYPSFIALVSWPGFAALLLCQTTLGIASAAFNVVTLPFKAQIFPAEVRGTCLSINNSVSALLFVGVGSVLVTWMLDQGIVFAPAHYLAATAALSVLGLVFIRPGMVIAIRSNADRDRGEAPS